MDWGNVAVLTFGWLSGFAGAFFAMRTELRWLRRDVDDLRQRVNKMEGVHMKSLGKVSLSLIAAVLFSCIASIAIQVASVPKAMAATGDPRPLIGSAVYDLASLVDTAGASTTVTVVGANLGDFCESSLSVSTQGITVTCNVTAANTATIRFQNETAGTLDLASGTLRAVVWRVPAGL